MDEPTLIAAMLQVKRIVDDSDDPGDPDDHDDHEDHDDADVHVFLEAHQSCIKRSTWTERTPGCSSCGLRKASGEISAKMILRIRIHL